MGIWIPLAMAGLGALRGIKGQNEAAQQDKFRKEALRWSPWTGMSDPGRLKFQDPFTSAIGGGLGGISIDQWLNKQGIMKGFDDVGGAGPTQQLPAKGSMPGTMTAGGDWTADIAETSPTGEWTKRIPETAAGGTWTADIPEAGDGTWTADIEETRVPRKPAGKWSDLKKKGSAGALGGKSAPKPKAAAPPYGVEIYDPFAQNPYAPIPYR